ncbi:MAG: Dak phosphatase [Nocardioidaceae bacterium]|nr:Dak phosphatase [Nocardioidaceae bacterium]
MLGVVRAVSLARMSLRLSSPAFAVWAAACVDSLGAARAEIDALNVFPVPDSDTGTNVYLTFVAARDAVHALPKDATLEHTIKAFVDGALLGAKGNSGVIMSQLLRASFRSLLGRELVEAEDVAYAFDVATQAAYAAVGDPKEGTILSVARAAADGAKGAADAGKDARGAFAAAAAASRIALQRTPQQMERLARAGVVDAGGRALVVVIDTTERYFTGRLEIDAPKPARTIPVPMPAVGEDLLADGPAYEVMYLLNAPEETIAPLRATLASLGDSLVVVGGDGLWNVHVHVDNVGAAIEAGIAAGHPYRIAVTHFADQAAQQLELSGRAVVVATTGAGLSKLCTESGAHVLEFDRDHQLGVEQMASAVRATGASEVIVLPNNPRYVPLFEAAAKDLRREGMRIAIIPSHAQVQGLAALAVHDAGRPFDDDVVAMSSAAAHVQHGAITVAAEAAMTMAGPCQAGDTLGVVAGDFAIVGADPVAVAIEVLDRLVSSSSEMVTLVVGAQATDGLPGQLERHLRVNRPDVDAVIYQGDQENYPLFIAVE